MTSDFDPISPEVNHSSPGKMLRDAREELGLTQEAVAKELYMTLTKVRYIEADEFNRLHSDTFIRGYLRAYGQLVKVDLQQLLAIYDTQAKRHGLKEEFIPAKQESSNRKIWQFVTVLLGLLLLMWLVSVWFLDNRKKNNYSETSVAPMTNLPEVITPGALESEVASTRITTENSETNPDAKSQETKADVIGSNVDVKPLSTASQLSIAAVASGKDKLEFYFSDECWLEVSDARGDVLATELQMKNSRLVLEGQKPFDVKVGNAPAVNLKLNNDEVKLVPALGTNVLTIKVGSSSGQ